MLCNYCGANIPEGSGFCPACRAQVKQTQNGAPAAQPQGAQPPYAQQPGTQPYAGQQGSAPAAQPPYAGQQRNAPYAQQPGAQPYAQVSGTRPYAQPQGTAPNAQPQPQNKKRIGAPVIACIAVLAVLVIAGVGLVVHHAVTGEWIWESFGGSSGVEEDEDDEKETKKQKKDDAETTDETTEPEPTGPQVSLTVDYTTPGEISSQIPSTDDTRVYINNEWHYFPLAASALSSAWKVEGYTGDTQTALKSAGGQNVDCVSSSGMEMTVKDSCMAADVGGDEKPVTITDLVLPGAAAQARASWVLPGGITPNSTAADVLSVYGLPGNNADFGAGARADGDTLYYPDQAASGLSYIFVFQSDGKLLSAELYVPRDLPAKPCVYENDYFKVELPGYWFGRYNVVKRSETAYEFQMKEGGHIFTLSLAGTDTTFSMYYPFEPLGTFKSTSATYYLAVSTPTDDQSPYGYAEEFRSMERSLDIGSLSKRITPKSGYSLTFFDYSALLGKYAGTSADGSVWRLSVTDTKYAVLDFTFGRVTVGGGTVELRNGTATVYMNGLGAFDATDSLGGEVRGTIRFADGKAYLTVEGQNMNTGGEIELNEGEEPAQPTTAQITISGDAIASYLAANAQDIIDSFGPQFEIINERVFRYPGTDILFQAESIYNGVPQGKITALVVENAHDLGGGVNSAMTVSEIASVFGGTGLPTRESADEDYSLVVTKNGLTYMFLWASDYNQKSDNVAICAD